MARIVVLLTGLFALVVLQANSCRKTDPDCPQDYHNGLVLSNQSTRTINFHFYWNYPDTTIGEYNPLRDGTEGLSQGEELARGAGPIGAGPISCWESVLKDEGEWLYIFDQDSLRAIPWDTVRATGRGLLERRFIDLGYLRANDFKVVYK